MWVTTTISLDQARDSHRALPLPTPNYKWPCDKDLSRPYLRRHAGRGVWRHVSHLSHSQHLPSPPSKKPSPSHSLPSSLFIPISFQPNKSTTPIFVQPEERGLESPLSFSWPISLPLPLPLPLSSSLFFSLFPSPTSSPVSVWTWNRMAWYHTIQSSNQ